MAPGVLDSLGDVGEGTGAAGLERLERHDGAQRTGAGPADTVVGRRRRYTGTVGAMAVVVLRVVVLEALTVADPVPAVEVIDKSVLVIVLGIGAVPTAIDAFLQAVVVLINESVAVVIHAADTGAGIGKEDMAHIFDPYFTTKPSGTGLGLAIVHNILEAHKGEINVESQLGQGTTITLMLPDVLKKADP